MLMHGLCFSLFKLTGWRYDKDHLWADKQVVIGFPHTSNMDAVRSIALFSILKIRTHTLIKKELFRWPLSWALQRLGGIPVSRGKKSNMVEQIANEFAKRDKFTLVLAPEASRSKGDATKRTIKTGFWHIAKRAEVPIVLMFSDGENKSVRFLGSIVPSDSMQADLDKIESIYRFHGIDLTMPLTEA